jgi:hypothetical protein
MIAADIWIQIAVIGLGITGGLIVLIDDRRLLLLILAVQYTFVALLISSTLNMQIAGSKWLAGIAACAIFLIYIRNTDGKLDIGESRTIPFNRFFRIIAVLLVILVAIGLGTVNLINLEGIAPEVGLGTALMVCLSFLHLGLCEEPMRVGIGLLTLLSGFEITYSLIEPSLAVVGLLACVHIGIALVMGYLLMIQGIDPSETREI